MWTLLRGPEGQHGWGAGGKQLEMPSQHSHPAGWPDTVRGQNQSLGIRLTPALGRMEEGLGLLRGWPGAKQPPGQLHRQLGWEGGEPAVQGGLPCWTGSTACTFSAWGGSLVQGKLHVQLLSALGWGRQGDFQESLGLQSELKAVVLKEGERAKPCWPHDPDPSFPQLGPSRRRSAPPHQLSLPSPQCPLALNQLL